MVICPMFFAAIFKSVNFDYDIEEQRSGIDAELKKIKQLQIV